ncbi:glycosyltransferase family 9 protein [Brevibacterium sp.]|uniref:glycosyltransferase family 9 protein n=1 Tax=Brevibacterium sp. TaxID=1701 RepID=UPI0028123BD0|nr:glycosyltransferase family 9 protein [Brevibacterium sp.]
MEAFDGVERIAVLRGGGLGDLMFAYPGLIALRATYPQATITLLGTELQRQLVEGRPGPIDAVWVLDGEPGLRDTPEQAEFFARARAQNFDLAVQLHGGGKNSNPFLLALGAAHTVGSATDDAPPLERTLPYVYYQHEMIRSLEVAALAGASPQVLEPELTVLESEARAGRDIVGEAPGPLLIVHPGATDPRRRWPNGHWIDVAVSAVSAGWQVIVVGGPEDREDGASIAAGARDRLTAAQGEQVRTLAGELTLPQLLGVFTRAEVVAGNDSGPRHLAAAVGAKTVGVYWVGNALNASPLSRARHRVLMSWVTRCPVCGIDITQVGWTAERCAHDPSIVAEVSPVTVWSAVLELAEG